MASQKASAANFLIFRNEADSNFDNEIESNKIMEHLYDEESTLQRTESLGYQPDEPLPYNVLHLRGLRRGGNICVTCGCAGSCKIIKPALVTVSTSIDHFGEDFDAVDPWPKRPIRKDSIVAGTIPRLIDPTIIETLIANVSIEQVSFPVAIRSMVRYCNSLCGQKWVLPKSLRRKINQSIMDRRRSKKKSKFTGNNKFVVHPSSLKKIFEEDDSEWLDIEEEVCVEESELDNEPKLGYLDTVTGMFVEITEEDDSVFSSNTAIDLNKPGSGSVTTQLDSSVDWTGWSTPEQEPKNLVDLDSIIQSLELNLQLLETEINNEQTVDSCSFNEPSVDISEVIFPSDNPSCEIVAPQVAQSSQNPRPIQAKQFLGIADPSMLAPDVKILRESRSKIAAFTEKGITEEVLKVSDAVLQGDGTSRGWIRTGKIFTTPIRVGGRNRRMGILSVSKETRENLKTAIIHRLKMMSIAASCDKITIWKNIIAFLSDKASENPGLMAEIAQELGVTHCPGEFFCLIHSVLGFDRSESQCFLKLQKEIGVTKLFSNLNYVDVDNDSFDAVNSSLDCILRLISPQFSHKAWSRFRKFSDFMEQHGEKNLAFAQRDKRFGGAAASAAVANYHWEHLQNHLSTAASQQSDRNQLACAVRALLNSEVVRFLVVSKALVGIILHEPFINSVVEQQVSRSQLLTVLPALYSELNNPPRDVLDLSQPALPSLTSSWSVSCYGDVQVTALKAFISNCDQTALRKLVICLLKADAVCLARQRGPEYNFGTGNLDHPQNVTNQLAPDKQHLLDTVPADNLESEHYFGDFTQRLAKCGSQYIDHISDCMTISSSADLAFKSHDWKSKEFAETFKKMVDCRMKFDQQQKHLRQISIDENLESGDFILEGRKKAAILQKLKEHGGPITSTSDMDTILSEYPDWETIPKTCKQSKSLRSLLRKEITYARDYIFDTLKKSGNPLFKLNQLSLRDMVQNLTVLYGERGEQLTADIEDVRSALDSLWNEDTQIQNAVEKDTKESEKDTSDDTSNLKKNDAIVFKQEDKLAMGIIEEIHPDEVWVIPLDQVESPGSSDLSLGQLWRYPEPVDLVAVEIGAILPCFPCLELDRTLSRHTRSGQKIVFRVFNDDVLNLFCKSV